MVAESVIRMREKSNGSALHRLDGSGVRGVACSMAQADSLSVSSNPGQYFLRYTSMQPETLPASAAKTIADRGLRAFAVGACYAPTASYPGGVYWIAVVFY